MQRRDDNKATGYLITWEGKNEGDLGHTSAYIEGPNGQVIHRSFFPSSHYGQASLHNCLRGILPVKGFNTKGPSNDAKYEGSAPTSILKLEGLDNFEAMQKEQHDFLQSIKTTNHWFSLNHCSKKNILHFGLSLFNMHRQSGKIKINGFDPVITKFPTPDDLITVKSKSTSTEFSNCTAAVNRLLKAGKLEVKDSSNPILSRLFPSSSMFQPAPFQHAIKSAGGEEMINKPEQLPKSLQQMISEGNEHAKNAKHDGFSIDKEVARHYSFTN